MNKRHSEADRTLDFKALNSQNIELTEYVTALQEQNEHFRAENEKWKPTGKKFTLGEQCHLTRFTKSKVVPLQQPEHVSTSEIVITDRFSNTSQKPLTRYKRRNKKEKAISTGIPTTAET
ncbi:hypothetical protein Tco_0956873 [Tanacetum coccineum]